MINSELVKLNKSFGSLDDEIIKIYNLENPWGMNVSIDLHQANEHLIKDEEAIKQFTKKLVDFIKMKAYGDPIIKNFGDDPKVAGISLMQLIETSSITAHFANKTGSVHLDIFSCAPFRPYETALFCKNYFKAMNFIVSPATFRF